MESYCLKVPCFGRPPLCCDFERTSLTCPEVDSIFSLYLRFLASSAPGAKRKTKGTLCHTSWGSSYSVSLFTFQSYHADNVSCTASFLYVVGTLSQVYVLPHPDAVHPWQLVSQIISRTLAMHVLFNWHYVYSRSVESCPAYVEMCPDMVVKEVVGFIAAGWSAHGLMEGGER